MQWLKRHWGWMLVAFALTTVLVFGGLTWATIVSLELQHAEADRQHERALDFMIDKATSMMDDALSDQLYLEDRRDFWEYKYATCDELAGCGGQSKVAADFENTMLPSWIKGHFQVSQAEGWYSPRQFFKTENGLSEESQSLLAQPWYENLKHQITYDELQQQISDMSWFHEFRGRGGVAGFVSGPNSKAVQSISGGPATKTEASRIAGGNLRLAGSVEPAEPEGTSMPVELCHYPRSVVFNGLFKYPDIVLRQMDWTDEEADYTTTVVTHRLMPVWLKPTFDQPVLTYIRTVEAAPGLNVYQGFAVDLDGLFTELLSSVRRDLFPSARLTPVLEQPDAPSLALMKTLPAQLQSGAPMIATHDSGWTVIHGAIAAAWVSAISLFAAIVLGLRNLISFAERRMQFTYDVTHELRTPLTTMRLYTEMLSSGLVADEATKQEYLETLDRETERLSGLVAGVLEYARVEHHSPKLDETPATLGEIFQDTRNRWEPYCERAGHKFVAEVNGLASTHLKTDRRLVQQILNILVDNACKYGRSEKEPAVTVRALKLNDGRIAIDVQDNGPGVPSRDRKSIFRPFRRGSVTEIGGVIPTGIGLGLALARRWARLLGGRVECVHHEKQTRGATFRLTLPKKAQVAG